MGKAFFISDVHLTDDASPKGEAILRLLKMAEKECDVFVVLGDLFDWWMSDGAAFLRKFPRVIQAIWSLRAHGCRVIYIEGNHDIHLGRFWREQLGVEVHTEYCDLDYQGYSVHMEHGDLINRDDKGYLALRWALRTRPVRWLSRVVPSEVVLRLGERGSKVSRTHSSQYHGNTEIRDRIRRYAEKLSLLKEFDLMLTGHTHYFDDYEFSSGGRKVRSINLGSWFDEPKYLSVSAGEVVVKKL